MLKCHNHGVVVDAAMFVVVTVLASLASMSQDIDKIIMDLIFFSCALRLFHTSSVSARDDCHPWLRPFPWHSYRR